MKQWLRRYLGICEIQDRQAVLSKKLDRIANLVDKLQASIDIITPGLGRIIAKLDPMYGTSEDDPIRRKASDDLAEATLKRLLAESRARQHTEGN